jgi:hypothetical protein
MPGPTEVSAALALHAAFVLVLAGCAGGGDWTKAGADEATAAREYQDCRDLAATAVRTDADIDQDILATRGSDLQRSGAVRAQSQATRDQTRDRAATIVTKCMAAKGFARAP